MKDARVWSFGGGVQSAAIAVMVVKGVLPRPDLIVIADTGREAASTWRYLDDVVRPLLGEVGLDVEVAPHSLASCDLYSHGGDLLMPAFTLGVGRLRGWCSGEWKRDVVSRYLRLRGVVSCVNWLGISADEARRVSKPRKAWLQLRFPLVELGITREACLAIVAAAGLPRPPRSSCWCCPHRGDAEWRELRDREPEDFARAVELDRRLRVADVELGGAGVFLHRRRVALELVDLGGGAGACDASGCDSGECWT
jgi:hypothetical protein